MLFGVLLGVAAAAFGVAAALGVASLPGDWSRWGLVASLGAAWVLWELLMHARARAYRATPPTTSPSANRMAIGIAVLIGLGVVIAVVLGWLNV